MKVLSYKTGIGSEISAFANDFAKLRMAVFKEFPYLYDGALEYEMDYVNTYLSSKDSLLFAVYDQDEIVGATTCIPLKDETDEVRKPFEDLGYDIESIFYFGESILLPAYRGLGIGHRFFDKRESHAKSFKTFSKTAFCSVNRPDDHPLKPEDYRSNERFWRKRGYIESPELTCTMSWLDIQESEVTNKELTFWMKEL